MSLKVVTRVAFFTRHQMLYSYTCTIEWVHSSYNGLHEFQICRIVGKLYEKSNTLIKPSMRTDSSQRQPHKVEKILLAKANLGTYLNEKCYSQYNTQLVFKCLVNPLTLRAAKIGLRILEISFSQKHFPGNNRRRNADLHPNNKFLSYSEKYKCSRRHFLEKLWVWMGWTIPDG